MCIRPGLLAAALLVLAGPVAGADDLAARLATCIEVADDVTRLACYDDLAKTARKATRPAPGDTGRDVTAQTAPLDDSVGRLALEKKAETQVYLGRLTKCEDSNAPGRQLFYLESGQIWQQRNSGGSRVRGCEADVEIHKIRQGYRLRIPAKKRTIRVIRVQ